MGREKKYPDAFWTPGSVIAMRIAPMTSAITTARIEMMTLPPRMSRIATCQRDGGSTGGAERVSGSVATWLMLRPPHPPGALRPS